MYIVDETQFSFSMLTNTAFHTKLSTLLLVKTTGHEIRMIVMLSVLDNVMKPISRNEETEYSGGLPSAI